jgi:hypothetical protein
MPAVVTDSVAALDTLARVLAMAPAAGLTLVHHSAQRKHILWDTLGA